MAYEIDSLTADCYEGTTCLVNKLNIRDEKILAQFESDLTLAKISLLKRDTSVPVFDFEYYKAIHKYIFEDLYEWAGKIRTVNFSKKGTVFIDCGDIEAAAKVCFDRLKADNYLENLPFDEFIDKLVDLYCTTNLLHPFREGNGRTQRVFLEKLIQNAGYNIDFSTIERDGLMIATIQSANGVTDGIYNIFRTHIEKQG